MTKIGNDIMKRIGEKDERIGDPEVEREYQTMLAIVSDIEAIGRCMPKKRFINALKFALIRARSKSSAGQPANEK